MSLAGKHLARILDATITIDEEPIKGIRSVAHRTWQNQPASTPYGARE